MSTSRQCNASDVLWRSNTAGVTKDVRFYPVSATPDALLKHLHFEFSGGRGSGARLGFP